MCFNWCVVFKEAPQFSAASEIDVGRSMLIRLGLFGVDRRGTGLGAKLGKDLPVERRRSAGYFSEPACLGRAQ